MAAVALGGSSGAEAARARLDHVYLLAWLQMKRIFVSVYATWLYTLAQHGLPQADVIAQTFYDIFAQERFRCMVVRHSQMLCYAAFLLRATRPPCIGTLWNIIFAFSQGLP